MMCNNQFGHVAGRKLTGARQGNEEIVNFVALNLITGKFGDRLSPNISKGRRKNNAFSLGKLTHINCRWIYAVVESALPQELADAPFWPEHLPSSYLCRATPVRSASHRYLGQVLRQDPFQPAPLSSRDLTCATQATYIRPQNNAASAWGRVCMIRPLMFMWFIVHDKQCHYISCSYVYFNAGIALTKWLPALGHYQTG